MLLLIVGANLAQASILYRIRFGYYPDKIRTVFDFDGAFSYDTDESKEKIILRLKNTIASPDIQSYVELNDLIVRYLEVEKDGQDIKITIPLAEPIDYNIFYLNDPPRLVVDFGREYLNIVSGGTIADGVEFLKVKKGLAAGPVTASVLRVDLNKARVRPALAQAQTPNIVESFVNLLTPWVQRGSTSHFYLDKVSNIVAEQQALAGINGTYFASNGRPLGALMIDQELLSYSIHDRTAFFLDEANQPYIDNLFISAYFTIKNGTRYKITGINQQRSSNDVIMYTPVWGEKTGTNNNGIEVVVANGKISQINVSDSKIPEDGYVLSANGPAIEVLADNLRLGDKLTTQIKIVPYNTSPEKIIHLISGGPRLLKTGRTYISKHEEKFQTDIAKGRAARTAVGITKEKELLLVTVDGPPRRQQVRKDAKISIGVTLEELSNLLLSLGAYEAMNLDGGSSSTMIINNRLANIPTSGYQRRVSNAIIIRPEL
ncbi:MAG: phosphodiester glycosidase family protein [Candidatus Margulisbacteria bacterium]|nr:phosphodiester glycosidase family protein [Candidatus Margulisiibacteriota bacterium]